MMRRTYKQHILTVQSEFKSSRVMTMDQLATALGISARNTRRHLKAWGAVTSYNKNGRFYAHPEGVCFDENGIWSYKGAYFSKYGNLRNTFVALVESSQGGLSGAEAGRILHLNPQSFLSHFRSDPRLSREKIGGYFVYFSAKPQRRSRQRAFRKVDTGADVRATLSDSSAIVLLVERIKQPSVELSELVRSLAARGFAIDFEAAYRFMDDHGILKKST